MFNQYITVNFAGCKQSEEIIPHITVMVIFMGALACG
jgi:hypothetical protein